MSLSLTKLHVRHSSNNTFQLSITTSLPSSGFVCILGKSGCGKSTLLHALGLLQPINEGSIKLDNREISSLKGTEKEDFLNRTIAFVFQNYQLIEDQSVIFNVALPMMISGISNNEAFKEAERRLNEIGFSKEKHEQLVNQCSGGEKQRVAVLRSMINNPSIILADEPTGALDSKNSELVMALLKEYSLNNLVIVVTHNETLANSYADRIIKMDGGKIISDYSKKVSPNIPIKKEFNTKKHSNSWINHFIENNMKKRKRRNIVSCFGICFSLVFAFLLFGFSNGASSVVHEESLKQFDLGVSTISNQKVLDIEGSKLSLVQSSRLSNREINQFIYENGNYTYGLNYSYLVPTYPEVKFENNILQEYSFNPVYSFRNDYCPNLIMEGVKARDLIDEAVVNNKLKEDFENTYHKDIVNQELKITYSREITTYFDNDITPFVIDYFSFEVTIKIKGVVNEVTFLNTPKIYYSYLALDNYLDDYLMSNLSKEVGTNISYKDKIDQCSANEELSSYSHMLFLKDYSLFDSELFKTKEFAISNSASLIQEALLSFIDATTMGMEIFLIITSLGSVLILGITSFSSYSQDKHDNAILLSLGSSKSSIFGIYIMENLLIGMISFVVSILVAILLSPVCNNFIYQFTNFHNMIQIPFKTYMNHKFLLPSIVFVLTLVTSFLTSYLPISFSGNINISKELKEE